MFDLLIGLTGLVLVLATLQSFRWSRDVLHPMLFLGPLFFLSCVVEPLLVRGQLTRFFAYPEDLNLVLALNLLSIAALAAGTLHGAQKTSVGPSALSGSAVTPRERSALTNLSWGLATVALGLYGFGLLNVGGFVAAFSRAKGGGYLPSGYLSEAMNLGLVAAAMAGLSRFRQGWSLVALLPAVFGLAPNLLQGTFGGRRGPLFLALTASGLAWTLVARRRPRIGMIVVGLLVIVIAVAFIQSQRHHLYLGSQNAQIRWDEFAAVVARTEVDQGNNFIYGSGFVLASYYADQHTWGRELLVNLFVRPVPRQLWPTKYADVGATWASSTYPGLGHLTEREWLAGVGWLPPAGSSASSISDLWGEFGWGTVVVMYLIGRGFAALRGRSRATGRRPGLWVLLYLEALTLTIYLATQSFSAFYHRFLILSIPTVIVWKLYVDRQSRAALAPKRILVSPSAMPAGTSGGS